MREAVINDEPVLRRQVGGSLPDQALRRIGGESEAGDAPPDQRFRRTQRRPDGDVCQALRQVDVLVVEDQIKGDARVRLLEGGQMRTQHVFGQGVGGGDDQRALKAQILTADAAVEPVDFLLDPFRRSPHLFAGDGQRISRRQTVEQTDAKRGLEAVDAPEYG